MHVKVLEDVVTFALTRNRDTAALSTMVMSRLTGHVPPAPFTFVARSKQVQRYSCYRKRRKVETHRRMVGHLPVHCMGRRHRLITVTTVTLVGSLVRPDSQTAVLDVTRRSILTRHDGALRRSLIYRYVLDWKYISSACRSVCRE